MIRTTRSTAQSLHFTRLLLSGLCVCLTVACSTTPIPSKFIRQAEPGVTLSTLVKNPRAYHGKVVILGGVVVAQKREPGKIWLLLKNRPLDKDYIPRELVSTRDPEAGQYWILVRPQDFPRGYRTWARLTVVGRVTDERPTEDEPGPEPVLAAMHLRGWGLQGGEEETWEDKQDPNYIMSAPKPVTRN